jgi:hypothetical protein
MACTNCTQTTASITGFVPANCTEPASCFLDAACVFYTGPALSCSAIATNDNLQTILQKIDPLLCAATGDYSTYNTYCLAPITTQKQFVESISSFVCTLRDDYDTFVGTTYADQISSIESDLNSILSPALTCASAGVTSADGYATILTKYCTKFGQIDTAINPSGANWNQCYVVSPVPTTITNGFNTLISQICILKSIVDANIGIPPTFNNVGSCLPAPLTAADSLVDTINKIKTRLCQTGTIDTGSLSFGCVSNTVSGTTDLQGTLQNILTKVTQIAQALPTVWSNDFVLSNTDPGNLCLGKTINLASAITPDRFVAATPSDMSPGTLQQKLIPGTNVVLDYITSPGYVVINSSAGTGVGDHKVAVDSSDTSPDYLGVKIATGGVVNGIQVIPTVDTINSVILLNISVNPNVLFQTLIDTLATDSTLYSNFCSAVAGCPSPCDAPSNVTVTYQSGGTTTSTTTTTTTT